jgi:hypothetical protein
MPNAADHQDEPAAAGGSASGINKLMDAVATMATRLPAPLQAVVVLGVLLIAGVVVYQKVFPAKPAEPATKEAQPVPANYISISTGQYSGGRLDRTHPGAENNLPQNLEADDKAAEDNAAATWHLAHLQQDDPQEVTIGDDNDPANHLHYRYFKSDRCLYIIRTEAGVAHPQWVKDPEYHMHDIHLNRAARLPATTGVPATFPTARLATLAESLQPAALVTTWVRNSVPFTPTQAGFCANPHPGQFRYWWGTPIDQCNSPMYRQFADGCTHYQIYNRCANSWDGRIFWVVCNSPPHH